MKTKNKECSIRIANSLVESNFPSPPSVDSYRILQLTMSAICENLYYAKLKLWDEFYLQLLENERLPYLNKRKKENIKSKKFNEWIFSNEDKKNILISQLTASIEREDLEKLFPSFKKAGNKHKRIDNAVNAILKNNFIETRKDEGNFKKQVLIENIEYISYNKIQTTVIAKMINKFNPNSKFTRYLINHTAGLSSYQQIRICELCYQYITTGSRKMEIQELKKFIGIGKNKTTSDLIRELKSSKKQINQKTNLEIEFITIKTSRKITHIKFNFCRTDQHPLDEINNKKNDLKAQLTDLGFKQERHKSLLKIPVEVLIPAINATKKTIEEKRIIKTIEACFYYQIGNLTDKNGKKFTNLELVSMFKENAGVKRHDLWNEFYAQLSKEQRAAYSPTSREKNKAVKEALDNDFTSKFNKWIYETKIKQ
ncbi:hypothetical protein BSPLISOX_1387 [uncultured Gammaproteobacteria bacterium]|nr:hypothetical protein [uncultured Gammaproteobacteria bacterium]VVH67060.1 hypothetical protein BSPLISOX_1387 [uncultured Gammaproteobacteria bacterium]